MITFMFSSGEERYETIDFSWGLPLKFTRHRIQRVSANLMTGTAMKVRVEAMVTTTELPYESVLVSSFPDGQERRHNISGTYQETLLTNIQVVEVKHFFVFSKHRKAFKNYPFESGLIVLEGGGLRRKPSFACVQNSAGNCAK